MKDDDKVVQLVTSKEPKPSDDEFYGMTDEVREFTFTSSNANLLSLLGAVAVTQSELLDISKGDYDE